MASCSRSVQLSITALDSNFEVVPYKTIIRFDFLTPLKLQISPDCKYFLCDWGLFRIQNYYIRKWCPWVNIFEYLLYISTSLSDFLESWNSDISPSCRDIYLFHSNEFVESPYLRIILFSIWLSYFLLSDWDEKFKLLRWKIVVRLEIWGISI